MLRFQDKAYTSGGDPGGLAVDVDKNQREVPWDDAQCPAKGEQALLDIAPHRQVDLVLVVVCPGRLHVGQRLLLLCFHGGGWMDGHLTSVLLFLSSNDDRQGKGDQLWSADLVSCH